MSLPSFNKNWVKGLNSLDLATLLYCFIKYVNEEDYEGAGRTYENTIKSMLNQSGLRVEQPDVENALHAANMLNSKGKFSHPEGLTFEAFVSRIVGDKYDFDPDYNWITKLNKPKRKRS